MCMCVYVGAQWEKARELFELMQQQGCTPDVVTYTALISAYERGGKWQLALQVTPFSHPLITPSIPFAAFTAKLAAKHATHLYAAAASTASG